MTRQKFIEYMNARFTRCENTFASKNREYATEENYVMADEPTISVPSNDGYLTMGDDDDMSLPFSL